MPRIRYEGQEFESRPGESVLEAFLRQGISVPFSCRTGICQVCLRRCVSGSVPEAAQRGVRPALRDRHYFLPCRCIPEADIEIAPPRDDDLYTRAVVHRKELLAPDVCRLLLEPFTVIDYRAGQFVNLRRRDGLARSYSAASVRGEDYFLELHVKRMRGGAMSNWIFDALNTGDVLDVQGPQGECYYTAGRSAQNLLLVATGTGLGPLLGIARDALLQGHAGEIHLYHGSRYAEGLYLRDVALALERRYPNFRSYPCVSGVVVPEGYLAGRADDLAFARHRDLRGWRVYLAGLPAMVHEGETRAARLGAQRSDILADAFELRDLRCVPRGAAVRPRGVDAPPEPAAPPPDPELWAALGSGELLLQVLQDFYSRVYADERLAPFFHGVTKQRSVEKQYLFMRQLLTGDKVYFGDRPRNAHHWMVVSEELFDYREELLMACLRQHGLPERLVRRWRAIDERYRRDIVKSTPWKRVVNGVELPLEGFGETEMSVGGLCDGCGREIAPGERVRYHLRLGSAYCADCGAPETPGIPGSESVRGGP
jgi:NAD(P)H-flavin reductase/truncated hemoglobin YjbI